MKTKQLATHSDCVDGIRNLKQPPHLVVCDPPYNISMAYDSYDDNKPHDEFMAWMESWISAAAQVLHKHGSFWIFCPDEWVADVDVYCRRKLKLHRRSWVTWFYTFGVACQKNFSRSHTHILYFTKTKSKFTFNADAIRVPSARQLVYNDPRQNPKGKLPDNTWILTKAALELVFDKDMDTWLVSRICGTYKERARHSSNQIPLAIMERIVLSCSDPGDFVLDPFAGTGSSGIICKAHNRNWTGFDISANCVKQSNKRIVEYER
jgi:site-specific DNA-methyltransferase (adenine-specific)